MKKEKFRRFLKSYDVFTHCVYEYIVRDLSFALLPIAIVMFTNIIFLQASFKEILSSTDFIFSIVMISATYVIDYTKYNITIKKRTNNVFFIGLNISILLLIFNVFFLVIVILKNSYYISDINDDLILKINIILFAITIVFKFSVFYESLSNSIFQSQKYFYSKFSHDLIADINSQLGHINDRLLSIMYDTLYVPTKKYLYYGRNFSSTKLYVESQIEDTLARIDKSISELETIKRKLIERKEEISSNCA